MAHLKDVEGIGGVWEKKLKEKGIRSTNALLQKGSTREGRKAIAAETGIDEQAILKWVNHVDLFRIRGVGEEYSDLLEAAGVDTVVELARRNPANLHEQLVKVNSEQKRVRKLPTAGQVAGWIEQAKSLPRQVNY